MLVEVITGTTREGRFSERVAGWVVRHLKARGDCVVELVDLREHPLPFFDAPAPARTPRIYPRDDVARLGETIDRADGFVVLTGEYNHGYPAVLKNAMDWTFVEWRRKPITFVGWGNVGGARAIEQLRQAVEFEMAPLRHAVHILPEVMMKARQAGHEADLGEIFAPLEPKLELLVNDLGWWASTLAAGRKSESGP